MFVVQVTVQVSCSFVSSCYLSDGRFVNFRHCFFNLFFAMWIICYDLKESGAFQYAVRLIKQMSTLAESSFLQTHQGIIKIKKLEMNYEVSHAIF